MAKKKLKKQRTNPPPTFAEVKRLYATLDADAETLKAQDKEMLNLHDMTYTVPAPDTEGIENYTPTVIRSGWTRQAIKRWKAMTGGKPVVTHEPGLSDASQRLSEKIEDFLNTLPWALEAAYGSFWSETREDVGKVGRGFVEVLPYRQRWTGAEGYPVQGAGVDDAGEDIPIDEGAESYNKRIERWKKTVLPPISIRHIPAHEVRAIITERYRVLQAVRKVEINLADAARRWRGRFEEALKEAPTKANDKVICWEYVDETWVAYGAEYKGVSEYVKPPWAHGMKICPWVLVEGLTTASAEPAKRWEPLLLDCKDVGVAMDAQLTRQQMVSQLWPLPVLHIHRQQTERPDAPAPPLDYAPPKPLVTYEDETVEILNWVSSQPEAEALWDKLGVAMDKALPDVGHDIASGASDTAAWTWRLRGQIVEQDMEPVMANISLGFKRIMQAVCRAILSPIIHETVYIRRKLTKAGKENYETIALGPKDIEGQIHNINAKIKVKRLIDRNSDLGASGLAQKLGLPDTWWMEKILEIENPQEIKEMAILERIEMSEPYLSQLQKDIMERADIIEAEEAEVPPDELSGMNLSPAARQAIQRVQMEGLGSSGIPEGAHPNTLERTGVGTAQPGGPSPFAPGPGEAKIV